MRYALSLGIPCTLALCATAASAAAHDGLHEQIVALTRAIERSPENAELYQHRAELRRLHHEFEAARADFERAQALDPRLAELALGRARLAFDEGRLADARELVERHLARHAGDPHGLVLRAELALRRADVEGAVRDYDLALARPDPPEPDLVLARADALARLGAPGVERALAGLDAGLARLGPVTALELRAVELELLRGCVDDALARLDGIAARSTRAERWLVLRGEILLGAGRRAEALEAFWAARDARLSPAARPPTSAAARELADTIDCRLSELSRAASAPR